MPYCTTDWYVSNRVGIGTDTPPSRLTIAPATNGLDSSIEFTNADNAVISSHFSQTFTVNNTFTQAGRSFVFASGGKGYANNCRVLMLIEADTSNVSVRNGGAFSVLRGDNNRKGCLFTDTEGTKLSSDVTGNDPLFLIAPGGSGQIRMCAGGNTTMAVGPSRVGIGTTSPSINLHVQGTCNSTVNNTTFWDFNFSGAEVTNLSNCPSSVAGLALIGGSGRGSVSAIANLLETTGAGSLGFFTGGGATGTVPEKMRINSTGNVGIGTSSPSQRLHVTGRAIISNGTGTNESLSVGTTSSSTGTNFGTIDVNGLDYSAYYLRTNDTIRFGIFQTGGVTAVNTITNIPLTLGTCDTERMRITATGNVGMGTTSPSYRLHVNGTFYAAGSSIKYKEGICNYNTDSCLFMCLKPVTYQYKDEFKHLGKELKSESQIGLIAEHVAEVMPELAILVNEEDNKVVRNVDYEKLSIILLSEVQKLRQEVDDLKNK